MGIAGALEWASRDRASRLALKISGPPPDPTTTKRWGIDGIDGDGSAPEIADADGGAIHANENREAAAHPAAAAK